MWFTQGVTAPSTAHNAFPSVVRVDKGGENLVGGFTLPHCSFLRPNFSIFFLRSLSSLPPSRSHPPLVAMASILSASRFRSESNLRKLRRLLGWQSPGFGVESFHSETCGPASSSSSPPMPYLGSCSYSSHYWRPTTFSSITFRRTPSR
jgi:hypothetical protein